MFLAEVVVTAQSSMRAIDETRQRSPFAYAPSPRSAHQRRPSAGAETRPSSTTALALQCEQRRPHRHAAHVRRGAVDRVDDPLDVPAVVAELFTEHALAAPRVPDAIAHGLLGVAVSLRNRRQVGLRVDAQVERAKATHRDRVCDVRELVREVERGGGHAVNAT